MSKLGRIAGRLLMAATFVESGLKVAREPGPRPKLAASIGIPQPELATRANGAGMAVGGILLATGIDERYAAGILAGLLVPTTRVRASLLGGGAGRRPCRPADPLHEEPLDARRACVHGELGVTPISRPEVPAPGGGLVQD